MRPALSSDDLTVFFEAHHWAVADAARALAAGWTPDHADEDAATRRAAKALADAGLLAWAVPERFGGAAHGRPDALDVRALCLVREALGWADGLLDTAFAMQGLGSYPITLAGSDAQKAHYLPGVLAGERLGAFALSEPDAGSDVAALTCRATRLPCAYRLNGVKTWISNAGVAGQYVVFASTDPAAGHRGISAFIVEPDDPGVTVERFQVTAPHPIGTLRLDGCDLPEDRLLGREGDGFKLAMQTLEAFRTTVAAAAVGMGRRALDEATAFAKARRQGGKPILEHQQIGAYLADGWTELDAARLLVYRAAHHKDTVPGRATAPVAMAKLFATEAAFRLIDKAVQIHGGRGVQVGSVVERLYREIRALRIYEGTSEIQKVILAATLAKG
ncbi:MAG: acyl-CoA dehydrogenase family protein [Myxococcales bacterium]|nr:acyl-CoA dehydrogenase family protein [Myxococcales bacterium]